MRGTFVFPGDDRDFMQKLEIRANNGAVDDVETVYVVTGSTYFVPEDLWAFDDPSLYDTAERYEVDIDDRATAETIRDFYAGRPGPRMIFRVHTHPPDGADGPSDQDYSVAEEREKVFDRYFDDYELFLGIHLLGEERPPNPGLMRVPNQTEENKITWLGENRKHTLAVYDGAYEPRPVMLTTAAKMQQHLQQARRQPQPQVQPEPEPEPAPQGEIWD